MLWAGLHADRIEVERMATGARTAVAKAGGAVDGQRFRAHLTLARTGRPIEASNWVWLLDAYAGPAWEIDRFDLVASHLAEGPRGRPRHETVGSFALGGGGR